MAQIEFNYKGNATIIQTNHDEKFKDILKKSFFKNRNKFTWCILFIFRKNIR